MCTEIPGITFEHSGSLGGNRWFFMGPAPDGKRVRVTVHLLLPSHVYEYVLNGSLSGNVTLPREQAHRGFAGAAAMAWKKEKDAGSLDPLGEAEIMTPEEAKQAAEADLETLRREQEADQRVVRRVHQDSD